MAAAALLLWCACGAALVLLGVTAAAQIDDSTGVITPASGVPAFQPAIFNRAYLVRLDHVPKAAVSPFPLGGISSLSSCNSTGFDSVNPVKAPMGSCFVREHAANATYDLWLKAPSQAREDANCYCYAMDIFRGGYCQPGGSNGGAAKQRYTNKMTCKALLDAVTSDGGSPVTRQQALGGQPGSGHYVVMLARPDPGCIPDPAHCSGSDYHVLRKDSSGTWSGKFPRSPADDRDLFGNRITDPEAAAVPGHYQVCGYFQVNPDKMVVETESPAQGPLTRQYQSSIDAFRSVSSIPVSITSLPYDPSDAVREAQQVQIFDEDAAWERKRGTKAYADWKMKQLKELGVLPGPVNTSPPANASNVGRVEDAGLIRGRRLYSGLTRL